MLTRAYQHGLRSIAHLRLLAALCRGTRRNKFLGPESGIHTSNIVVALRALQDCGFINAKRVPTKKGRELVKPLLDSDDRPA